MLYSILKMPFNETLFYSFYFEFRFRILLFSKYRHLKEESFLSLFWNLEKKKKIICKFLFLDEGSISTSEVSKRIFSHFLRRKVLRISFER